MQEKVGSMLFWVGNLKQFFFYANGVLPHSPGFSMFFGETLGVSIEKLKTLKGFYNLLVTQSQT